MLCVVCASLPTASFSRLGATDPRRSTTPRRGTRPGEKSFTPVIVRATLTQALCSTLIDESAKKTGDLYIRSVCFSPDGKYLATGAEDKVIRVSAYFGRPSSEVRLNP